MITPIADSITHQKALRRIEKLWDATPGSREERELDALATLVDAYERRSFPIEQLSAIDAIKVRCEQLGWSRKELEPLIGSRARVSEVLTGKRPLTLAMIRSIHRAMAIPADILICEPHEKGAKRPRTERKRRSGSGPSVARTAGKSVASDAKSLVRLPARG